MSLDDHRTVPFAQPLRHADCLACGRPAPVGKDGGTGDHGDGSCPATGHRYQVLRGIARLAGSWTVRWAEDGTAHEQACGEHEARREALRRGGIVVSPAVIRHLRNAVTAAAQAQKERMSDG